MTHRVGGEPATEWGANIVGEQDGFLYKMDYQTARYAAENAKWYAASGDAAAQGEGLPLAELGDVHQRQQRSRHREPLHPEHRDVVVGLLRRGAADVLPRVRGDPGVGAARARTTSCTRRACSGTSSYAAGEVKYTPTDADDIEYLRLTFAPAAVTVGGVALSEVSDLSAEGYTVRSLGGGDYAVNVRRMRSGAVVVCEHTDRAPRARRGSAPPRATGSSPSPGTRAPAPGLAGYNLYRSTTSPVSTGGTRLNGGTPLTATSYTDTGLANGTPYYYAVTAVGTSGERVGAFRRGLRHPRGERGSRPRLRRHERLRDVRGGPRARCLRVHRRGLVQEDGPRRGGDDGRDPGDPERRPPRDQGPRRGGGRQPGPQLLPRDRRRERARWSPTSRTRRAG